MKNLRIKNMTETSADLYIHGDIVDDGWKWFDSDITPADVRDQLDTLKGKELNVYINSGGGDVFAGTAIHNMLKRHEGKTVGHVDGVAASIASVILMACDEIVVPANAYVMIHRPMCSVYGNTEDLLHTCDVLETIEEGIINTYQLHSDLSRDELSAAMAAETWMTGDQFAESFGKNVTVTDPVQAVACSTNLSHRRWPKAVASEVQTPESVDLDRMKIEIELALN